MSAATSVALRRAFAILLVALALSLPNPISAATIGSWDWFSWGNSWSDDWSSWGNDWNDWDGWFDDDDHDDWWDGDDDWDNWYDFDDWRDHEWDDDWKPEEPPVSVPEPASLTLLVTGLVGLGAAGRRKRDE